MSGCAVCEVCPRHCELDEGQFGVCGARCERNGQVVVYLHGQVSACHMDPVEKKPLYHYYPGERVLSLGGYGCNLMCRGCQNHNISRIRADRGEKEVMTTKEVIDLAWRQKCRLVAYTYNEPIVWWEYADEVAREAHASGMKNIMVTAGYIDARMTERVFANMDAANVDLKGFDESFYRTWAGGELAPVLDTLLFLHRKPGFWLEITTLLIPGVNDSRKMLEAEFSWIVENLGCNVPLHLSAFHPAYKAMNIPRTDAKSILDAVSLAKEHGLRYVYPGNVAEFADTVCAKCGKCIVARMGYHVDDSGLKRCMDGKGRCTSCNEFIPGIYG